MTVELEVIKSPGWSLHLCCASYQTGKWEGLVSALKKPPKEVRQRCNDTFYYCRHLQAPITTYICKERKLNPDPTFRLGTLQLPVISDFRMPLGVLHFPSKGENSNGCKRPCFWYHISLRGWTFLWVPLALSQLQETTHCHSSNRGNTTVSSTWPNATKWRWKSNIKCHFNSEDIGHLRGIKKKKYIYI